MITPDLVELRAGYSGFPFINLQRLKTDQWGRIFHEEPNPDDTNAVAQCHIHFGDSSGELFLYPKYPNRGDQTPLGPARFVEEVNKGKYRVIETPLEIGTQFFISTLDDLQTILGLAGKFSIGKLTAFLPFIDIEDEDDLKNWINEPGTADTLTTCVYDKRGKPIPLSLPGVVRKPTVLQEIQLDIIPRENVPFLRPRPD